MNASQLARFGWFAWFVALLLGAAQVIAQEAQPEPVAKLRHVLPEWDPGFGPHQQGPPTHWPTRIIRAQLDCPKRFLICCDPCGLCVCEDRGLDRCPDIMMMSREHCR